MRTDVVNSCHTAMRLKGFRDVESWLYLMEDKNTPGDEFVLYLLGKMYYRHVVVMTGQNLWSMVENHQNMSLCDLLSICSVHLMYLGKNQYGIIRKKNTGIVQHTPQQIIQRNVIRGRGRATHNRAYNYSRTQTQPLNLTMRGTAYGRGVQGRGNINMTASRSYVQQPRINPVQALGRVGTTMFSASNFTITSEFVSHASTAAGRTPTACTPGLPNCKHPEVEQVVQRLLDHTNTPSAKDSDKYKHPEVEQIVSKLLQRNKENVVDLTEDDLQPIV